ncbi:MAG: HPr-rel-A system PqqD family peptide chaperone [Vicinamibacterales bacterium]
MDQELCWVRPTVKEVLVGAGNGWKVRPGLVWTTFDGESDCLVFNQDSADIHLVSSAAHVLCQIIDECPACSDDRLMSELASALDRPVDNELIGATHEMLVRMDRIGMIQRV